MHRLASPAVTALMFAVVSTGAASARRGVALFPSGAEFELEIVSSVEERARGYMFRDRVAPREAMLFVFEHDGRHDFWMKNCRVALDIIWLDANLHVVHVAPDQRPCPAEGACPEITPLRPGRYVIEVAAGTAREQGLELGQRIVVLAEPPLP